MPPAGDVVVPEERWSDADGDRLNNIWMVGNLSSGDIQSFLNRAVGEEARLRESGDTQSADALAAQIATANNVHDPEMLAHLNALATMSREDAFAIVRGMIEKQIELEKHGNKAAADNLGLQMGIFGDAAYHRRLLKTAAAGIVPVATDTMPAASVAADDEGWEEGSAPAKS